MRLWARGTLALPNRPLSCSVVRYHQALSLALPWSKSKSHAASTTFTPVHTEVIAALDASEALAHACAHAAGNPTVRAHAVRPRLVSVGVGAAPVAIRLGRPGAENCSKRFVYFMHLPFCRPLVSW